MADVDVPHPLPVAIVSGGLGPHRGESQASARTLAHCLSRAGFQPALLDPAEVAADSFEWPAYQLCHVAVADDGQWHRRLEARGILHTGSSAEAIELAASRTGARQYFLRFDVPTPAFTLLRSNVSPLEAVARVASLGYPLLLRPDDRRLAGTRLVQSADELIQVIAEMFRDTPRVMCERLLAGRAFAIVLQGEHALPPVELATNIAAPVEMPLAPTDTERQRLEHVAGMAAASLGMSGLVQVDLILDRAGRAWVLEINPLPSLAEDSPVAAAAERAGITMMELCRWMVQDCVLAESLR